MMSAETVPVEIEPQAAPDSSGSRPVICHWKGGRSVDALLDCPGLQRLADDVLSRHGALLLRDTPAATAEEFERAIGVINAGRWAKYREIQSPRRQLSDKVFTSTEHPASQRIHLHHENGHLMQWPGRISFFCRTPAEQGGATTIADVEAMHGRLSPETRNMFHVRGVQYSRSFGYGFGFSWRQVFEVETHEEAELYFRLNDIDFTWIDDEKLHIRFSRPAYLFHPLSGQRIWFNNVVHYHPMTVEKRIGRIYRMMLTEDQLPYNVKFGDGSEIPESILSELWRSYEESIYVFDWNVGDILMLDNMRFAHGREPFMGNRQIYVAMNCTVVRSRAESLPNVGHAHFS